MPYRFVALAVCLAAVGRTQDVAARADRFIQYFVNNRLFQGTVLVAQDGQPVFRKAYGWANADWRIPNGPDTKYRIGSMTKQFTAALVMQLVEQNRLSLDDSIVKYYPDAKEVWRPVTIHHLLSHTSGIPDPSDTPGFMSKFATVNHSPAEIMRLTAEKPLEFAPGTEFKYDNGGYVLLGWLIERLVNKHYDAQLRQALLDPIGMKDSGYDHYDNILPNRAEGYNYKGLTLFRAPYVDMSVPFAAAAMYSTVDDLLKWDQALYGDKILSEASKQKMWTPGLKNFGYGWMIEKRWGGTVLEHGGGINGYNGMIVRMPEKKLLAVVLGNLGSAAPFLMADGLLSIALGNKQEDPKPHTRTPMNVVEARPFEGEYELHWAFSMKVREAGDVLLLQFTGQPPMRFEPMGGTRFFNDQFDAELEFAKDGSSLVLYQSGAAIPFQKR
jgi:CubicO group peptidase (beta-lactamase class C family)